MLRFIVLVAAILVANQVLCEASFVNSPQRSSSSKVSPPSSPSLPASIASPVSLPHRRFGTKRDSPNQDCTLACNGNFSDARPILVTVGVYITQVSQVDIVGQNYFMTGYYWLYWPTCTQLPDDRFQPYDTIVIENQSAQWGLTLTQDLGNVCTDNNGATYTCPTCNTPSEGYSYVTYKFSANLKLTFEYDRYPLDEQEIYIAFEDLESESSILLLQVDPNSNYHETVNIISFDIKDVLIRSVLNQHRTNYGIPKELAIFSRAELGIVIKRNPVYFILRVLPPALVTLSVAALALFIDPMAVEVRLGVAVTGLLTMVLMGLGFSEKIPDVARLTVNDWFFNWCYFLLLLVVIECVFISFYMNKVSKILIHADLGASDLLGGLFNEKWEKRKMEVRNAWNRLRGKPENMPTKFNSEDSFTSTTPFKKFGEEDLDVEMIVQDEKEKAKRFIHTKLKAAKRLDYILASIILLLATIGSVIVIILAKYA